MTEPAPKESTLASVGRGARVEVAAEVAALAAYIVTAGEVDDKTLRSLLVQFGLCVRGIYDPDVHGDLGEDIAPGDAILLFTADAHEMFAVGRPHLRPLNGKLH